jgi:hypothetical protein
MSDPIETVYKYPTKVALAASGLTNVQLNNLHARGHLPEFIFRKPKRDRFYAYEGLKYLSLYAQAAVGARINSPTKCDAIVFDILNIIDKAEKENKAFDFVALASGFRDKRDTSGNSEATVWGPISMESMASRFNPDPDEEEWSGFKSGETFQPIPVKKILARLDQMTSDYDEGVDINV